MRRRMLAQASVTFLLIAVAGCFSALPASAHARIPSWNTGSIPPVTYSAIAHNVKTGQDIVIPMATRIVMSNGVIEETVTANIPRTLFGLPARQSIAPYDSTNTNKCDSTSSWCVSQTMYFYTTSDYGDTCTILTRPSYLTVWTRLDPQVTASAWVHAGAGTGSDLCGGHYYAHADHNWGTVSPGEKGNDTPQWVGRSIDTSSYDAYSCVDAVTTFYRGGSTWSLTVHTGQGTCPSSIP